MLPLFTYLFFFFHSFLPSLVLIDHFIWLNFLFFLSILIIFFFFKFRCCPRLCNIHLGLSKCTFKQYYTASWIVQLPYNNLLSEEIILWFLSLIFGNSQVLLLQLFLCSLLLSPSSVSIYICHTIYNCATVVDYPILFFFLLFFSLSFSLSFYWHIFKSLDYFLGPVQSINELVKDIFLSVSVFYCYYCLLTFFF